MGIRRSMFVLLFVVLFVSIFEKKSETQEVEPLTKSEAVEFQQNKLVDDSYDRSKDKRVITVKTRSPKKMGRRIGRGDIDQGHVLMITCESKGKKIESLSDIACAVSAVTETRGNSIGRTSSIQFLASNPDDKKEEKISEKMGVMKYDSQKITPGDDVIMIESFVCGATDIGRLAQLLGKDVVEYQISTIEDTLSDDERQLLLNFIRYVKYLGDNSLDPKK